MINLAPSGVAGKKVSKMDDSLLDKILDSSSFDDINIENSILEDLLPEINLVRSDEIRSFVRSVLLKSDYFWSSPDVEGEPERPFDEVGPNRTVLHTKRTARIANIIAEAYFLGQEEHDIVLAAALLHDVARYKDFEVKGEVYQVFDPMHPYTVSAHVALCQEADKESLTDSVSTTLFIGQEQLFSILRVIRCQLGSSSHVPETYPVTYLDHIVHTSITLANKIHTVIFDSELINEQWRNEV